MNSSESQTGGTPVPLTNQSPRFSGTGVPPIGLNDPAPGKTIVLYDGLCAFCQRGVRILRRLDWLKRLHYQDARDVEHLPPCGDPLDPVKLLDEMHVVAPDRRKAWAGYRAMRWLAWQLPLGWCVAPFLYVPGIPWVGNRLY